MDKHDIGRRNQYRGIDGTWADGRWKDSAVLSEMYVDGLSCGEIADELGCTEGNVRYWMNRFGIERRSVEAINEGRRRDGHSQSWRQSSDWRKTKRRAAKRDGDECWICGVDMPSLVGHHAEPVSEGGSKFDPSNVLTVCSFCHRMFH